MIAAMFVLYGNAYADLCHLIGQNDEAKRARQEVSKMTAAIEKHAWDGEWFLRAYDAKGNKIGSQENEESKIFIESQGFAAMAGVGLENGKIKRALDSVKTWLACDYGIVLNYPAYTRYYLEYGKISTYPQGYKENGGIFTHNNPWVIIGETVLGRGDRASDLINWERLPDLITESDQQRNVVLHPEFVDGKYALYTRPQDGFIRVGGAGGIYWGLSASMDNAEVFEEVLLGPKRYHTITETKNGQGPPPLRTDKGWLHLAHGVRNTAAGLRYVLYVFMTDLDKPWLVTHRPAGHLVAPRGEERVGDVSNVVFSNGWIRNDREEVFIYYASSDTRTHVATSSEERLVDYCIHTPEDGLRSATTVDAVNELFKRNESFGKSTK